ncbi:MAG: hypothetical protein JHC38_06285 [Thiotrichales bacterium]|jgi:hypothetical protein|nr:hypothetical protein [Thiotrichales bacterium]
MKKLLTATALVVGIYSSLASSISWADEALKPYVLANPAAVKADDVKKALTANGFQIAGTVSPYAGATVIVATNDALKKIASASKFGGYGAMIRVAVTDVNGQPQASYVNPEYMKNAYRMKGDMTPITTALEQALGKDKSFGSADGLSASELRKYHYMMAMPYFDDQLELGEFDNYQAALAKVEAGLTNGKGVKKVYRIDIPGKEEAVFGVAITEGDGADKTVMSAIDTGALRHTAHLPYEVLVSGKNAYMLHGKFRIAQSFPDLSMGNFMSISAAPDAIETILKENINK